MTLCALFSSSIIFCWDMYVMNETNQTITLHLYWLSTFCSNGQDRFSLKPKEKKTIRAGLCDLDKIDIDGGEGLTTSKETGNPVKGVKIIETKAGKLKVVRMEDKTVY